MGSEIEVMVSSTVSDLREDREAAVQELTGFNFVKLLGVAPIASPSAGASSYVVTADIARDCHLYILILGRRYGHIAPDGRSATEVEFDAAYDADPTKILVFRKAVPRIEPKQKDFIERVTNYHKGYFVRHYQGLGDLRQNVPESFRHWLMERAAIGKRLHYFDHFLRMAIQRSPFPGVQPLYTLDDTHIELKYIIMKKIYAIQFSKDQIFNDFWGSIGKLEGKFREWRRTGYG